ncbi:MAG: strawberry notch C-terminal domain-containing protein [Rhodanobacter sp.]
MVTTQASGLKKWVTLNEADPEVALRAMQFPSGIKRLVVVGDRSLSEHQLAQLEGMGYYRTRSGVLVCDQLSFNDGVMRRIFPKIQLAALTVEEISGKSIAVGADGLRPDGALAIRSKVFSFYPLGVNHQGQTVMRGEDGRFILSADKVPLMASMMQSGAMFLYGQNAEDLAQCADGFVRQIVNGRNMRFADMREAAAVAMDVSVDRILYTPQMRQYQEAIEAALVRYLREHGSRSTPEGYELARRLEEGQPAFQSRTSESVTKQQYSTPLTLSTIVQRILGPVENKTVLGPSIGNGSLVSLLRGATVAGVDLDPKRVAQAQEGMPGAAIVEGDATAIDFTALNDGKPFDFVIANPPFGGLKAPISMLGLKVSRIDHQILMRALEARADNGVGVFIIGADSSMDRQAGQVKGGSRYLFNWLADHYDTQVVEVDGGMFAKQGAGFPTRVVVVWGKGKSVAPIPDQLEVIKDHDTLLDWANVMAAKTVALDQQRKAAEHAQIDEAQQAEVQSLIDEASETSEPEPATVETTIEEVINGASLDAAEPAKEHELPEENGYQSPYAPASNVGEPSSMIPRNLASATREALDRLSRDHGDIDTYVAEQLDWTLDEMEAYLSPEQVDAVALAIAARRTGRALLEGDQTGLGKGRVMAAMARYAALQGIRTVFLTETPTLFTDLYRDIRDIGSEGLFRPLIVNSGVSIWDPVTGAKLVPATATATVNRQIQADTVDSDYNLILATYSQFNRDKAVSAKSRWIATAASGASLLLDEAHNAAGDSNTGENIRQAVELAESVTYSSATSIKQSSNVLLYSRLFPDSVDLGQLPQTLQAGGEVLQEVLSGMLASDGVFIRREHDLSALEFRTVTDVKREARHRDQSDRLASILELMNYLAGDINKLVNERNKEIQELLQSLPEKERAGNRMGAVSMNFGSRLFAIYRQFQMAIKTDLATEEAIGALAEGKKPVIVLENTMESLLRDLVEAQRPSLLDDEESPDAAAALAQEVALEGTMTFRDVLHRMLGRLSYYNETSAYGEVAQVEVSSKEALAARESIRKLIEDFPDLPVSPLDDLRDRIAQAGYRCDELSGRKMSIERRDDKAYAVPLAERPKAHIVKDFNTGRSDALLLTGAGSTGISLHASEKYPDQRQRVMIELQSAADVNRRVQFFGRVNRKGQVCAPEIRTLSSGLIGEARPIAMQNAKLRRLSANTTSNQDNAALDRNVPDFINAIGDEVAKRYLESHPQIAARLDIDMDRDEETRDTAYFINKLTSRLVMLTNNEQESIYEILTKEYLGIIDELNAKGTNPLRSKDFDVKARLVERQIFEAGDPSSSSQFALPVYINTIEYDEVLQPMRSPGIEDRIREGESAVRDAKINTQGLEPRSFLQKLRTALVNGKQALMQQVLSDRFKSLEDALAAKEVNSVQRMAERLKFLEKTLADLDVGALIRFTGNEGEPERGVVTRVSLPQKAADVHLPGAYELQIAVPGHSNVVIRTLYSLQSDEQFVLMPKYQLPDLLRQFDLAPEGLVQRRRLLLDGNLFAAAQIAAARHLGSSVVYTDAEGRRHRGVLLSRQITRQELTSLPVRMESAEIAVALLNRHPEVTLVSTGDRDRADTNQDAAVMVRGREVSLAVPGTKTRGGQYFEDKDLQAITGEFNGNRQQMVATFALIDLEAALDVLYRKGISFYAPATKREAYNDIKTQLYSNKSQTDERAPSAPAVAA